MAFGDVFRRAATGARRVGVTAAERGAEAARTAWERGRERVEPATEEVKARTGRAWGEAKYRAFERPEETVRAERFFKRGAEAQIWRELGRETFSKMGAEEQGSWKEQANRDFIETFGEEEFAKMQRSGTHEEYLEQRLGSEIWKSFTPAQREYYTETRAKGWHARRAAREEAAKLGIPEEEIFREKIWKGPSEGWEIVESKRKRPEHELRLLAMGQRLAEEKLGAETEAYKVRKLQARHEMIKERAMPLRWTAGGFAKTARSVGAVSEARLMRPVARPIREITPTGMRGDVFALQRPTTLITAPPPGTSGPAPQPVAGLEHLRSAVVPTVRSTSPYTQELRRVRRSLWR